MATPARGPALDYKGFFYDFTCAKGPDITFTLTPQQLRIIDVGAAGAGNFAATVPGVVLLRLRDALTASEPQASTDPAFAASGVVIDGDFLAVYERQGSGLLQMNPRQTNSTSVFLPSPVAAGFSYGKDNDSCSFATDTCGQSIDDW